MITIYLLKSCVHCKKVLEYVIGNTNKNISIIFVDKNEAISLQNYENSNNNRNYGRSKSSNRFSQFPVAFIGSVNKNMPAKNSRVIKGSDNIIYYLKTDILKPTSFGQNDLVGSNIDINYKNDNTGNINNIHEYRNCFGSSCNTGCSRMDRPFGPCDNKYLLQGYQPPSAMPPRSHIPLQKNSNFGMATPGTQAWKNQRQDWPTNRIQLFDESANKAVNNLAVNIPQQYRNNELNTQCRPSSSRGTRANPNPASIPISRPSSSPNMKFGNNKCTNPSYKHALVLDRSPMLTYAAGGDGVSRITGKPFYNQQIPIGVQSQQNAYIKGNIKDYVNSQGNSQQLLKNGLNSKYSINAQGISKFGNTMCGNNKQHLVQTAFNSDQGTGGVAQLWCPNANKDNGNSFGSKSKPKPKPKPKKVEKKPKPKAKFGKKYTSPLGVEIIFE